MDHRNIVMLGASLAACLGLGVGCESATDPPGTFVSDNPHGGSEGADGGGAGEDDSGDGPADGDGDGGDGGRAIEEADLIQIEGDRLYALSQRSGLTVVDISERDRLPVLGRFRAHAQPFEMYVDAGQVFVMFNDYGSYRYDEADGWAWRQSSRLMALDASEPADIEVRGEFDLPGQIQDSRRVGDVLYLVTHENGYCWRCKDNPNTTITSLSVADRTAVEQIDQLSFEAPDGSSGRRSVSSTNERMYVGGESWWGGDQSSVIQVVDISDAGGALIEGASLEIAGQIRSRWQMDEYDGVLRVISQPWDTASAPEVETFTIVSSNEITPLASLELQLPRPESLRSVRFDGERAYAITFEQTDPLFTLDLSDPANPRQLGELEIPGWVYHMEPRGDRILGLGFDRGNPEGSINVSLFDVSDMSQPTLVERVHFGGDWADFTEDQNRIHKAFTILDELGLLLVPFEGYEWSEEDPCGGYRGGIQIIDFGSDDLTLRGLAEGRGRPRRSFMHDDRLFSVGDRTIQTFDITDRDAPAPKAELSIAVDVRRSARVGQYLVRFSSDWWTDETRLDVVTAEDPEMPEALGSLSLQSLLADRADGRDVPETSCHGLYDAELLAVGDFVYLVFPGYATEKGSTHMAVIDLTDPASPTHVRTTTLPFSSDRWYGSFGALRLQEQRMAVVGSRLVLSRRQLEPRGDDPADRVSKAAFVIVDVSDPANPAVLDTLDRPEAMEHGNLRIDGETVMSWHVQKVSDDGSKVAFHLERLDLSDPAAPVLQPAVNVPGLPLTPVSDHGRVMTLDFRTEVLEGLDADACFEHLTASDYDWEHELCTLVHHELNIVRIGQRHAERIDRIELSDEWRLEGMAGADTLAYGFTSDESRWGGVSDGVGGNGGDYEPPTRQVTVYSGLQDGQLVASDRMVLAGGFYYWNSRIAGDRLLTSSNQGLAVVEASDPEHPTVALHELYGYGCQHIEVADDIAYCSMGGHGLQAIPLSP